MVAHVENDPNPVWKSSSHWIARRNDRSQPHRSEWVGCGTLFDVCALDIQQTETAAAPRYADGKLRPVLQQASLDFEIVTVHQSMRLYCPPDK